MNYGVNLLIIKSLKNMRFFLCITHTRTSRKYCKPPKALAIAKFKENYFLLTFKKIDIFTLLLIIYFITPWL